MMLVILGDEKKIECFALRPRIIIIIMIIIMIITILAIPNFNICSHTSNARSPRGGGRVGLISNLQRRKANPI